MIYYLILSHMINYLICKILVKQEAMMTSSEFLLSPYIISHYIISYDFGRTGGNDDVIHHRNFYHLTSYYIISYEMQ